MDLRITERHHLAAVTIDHVVPVSQGGTGAKLNARAAHQACNIMRGNRTPEEARRLIREAIERAMAKRPEQYNRRDRFVMLIPKGSASLNSPAGRYWVHTVPVP